jgi:Glycosyltransferase family 87
MSPGLAYALIWVGFIAYVGALLAAPALGPRLVWGTIGVLVAAFAVAPVLLSHDVFSYVDYARLGARHGLNPYTHPPAAAPGDTAFAEVEWTQTTSVYGPLFTLATYPLAWVPVGVAVAALKAAAAASVLGMAALVARLAPLRGVDGIRAAAFVALNPLVLVHVVGGAHNDGLAMFLATLGVAAALSARETSAGAAFVSAAALKSTAGLAFPFALLGARRPPPPMGRFRPKRGRISTVGIAPPPMGRFRPLSGRNRPIGGVGRFVAGAAVALIAIAIGANLAFGWEWLHAIGLAAENQGRASHMSLPITFARLTGLDPLGVRIAALALYAALFCRLLAWTWRGGDWLRAAAWASVGLLLVTAWLLPWYLIWALPFAALSRDRPLQLLALTLTAFQLTARIPI